METSSSSQSDSSPEPDPQIITNLSQFSPEELAIQLSALFDRKASELFLVFSKDKTKHIRAPHDPSRPWVTRNRKQAERVAKECNGLVIPLDEAIKLMMAQELKKHN